jgi:hypothetical protein
MAFPSHVDMLSFERKLVMPAARTLSGRAVPFCEWRQPAAFERE